MYNQQYPMAYLYQIILKMIKDIHVLVHVDIRKQIMRFEKNVGDISCKMKDVTQ